MGMFFVLMVVGWLDNTANLNTATDRSRKILNSTPIDRYDDAEEFIGTILFLASKKAPSFINGVVILVDGLFSAY